MSVKVKVEKNESKSYSLRELRAVSGKEPTYQCPNCKCMRYSPCGCTKKVKE